MKTRMLTLGASVATVSILGTFMAPTAAEASSKGRKNTAVGLGAAAAHQILTGKTQNGVLLGAGAAYAYKRYKDAERDEKRQQRVTRYRNTTTGSRYGAASTNRTTRTQNGTTVYRTREASGTYVPNGSYYFTGRIVNDASDLVNRRITIDHNGVLRRVDVPRSAPVLHAGETISMHELRKGDMVKVLATRTPNERWSASRVEVLNAANVAPTTTTRRDEFGDTVTRDRFGSSDIDLEPTTSTSSRYSGVGIVRNISADGHSIDVRVGNNVRTIFVDDARFSGVGGASELRVGDRVRIVGMLEGRDVFANQITLVD